MQVFCAEPLTPGVWPAGGARTPGTPGGEQTLTGPCAPSGNVAAPSSGLKRSGEERESLEAGGNAEPGNSLANEHVRN